MTVRPSPKLKEEFDDEEVPVWVDDLWAVVSQQEESATNGSRRGRNGRSVQAETRPPRAPAPTAATRKPRRKTKEKEEESGTASERNSRHTGSGRKEETSSQDRTKAGRPVAISATSTTVNKKKTKGGRSHASSMEQEEAPSATDSGDTSSRYPAQGSRSSRTRRSDELARKEEVFPPKELSEHDYGAPSSRAAVEQAPPLRDHSIVLEGPPPRRDPAAAYAGFPSSIITSLQDEVSAAPSRGSVKSQKRNEVPVNAVSAFYKPGSTPVTLQSVSTGTSNGVHAAPLAFPPPHTSTVVKPPPSIPEMELASDYLPPFPESVVRPTARDTQKHPLSNALTQPAAKDFQRPFSDALTFPDGNTSPGAYGGKRRLFSSAQIMDQGDSIMLPEDVCSMLFLSPLHNICFWYSVAVYTFQVSILVLALSDMMRDDVGSNDSNVFNVPPTTTTEVALSQFLALLVAVLNEDDVTHSLILLSASFGPEFEDARIILERRFGGAKTWQYWLANTMRLAEGSFTLFVTAILIIQSETVLDIFLNFAAMEFVSELDNLGWRLGNEGWLGHALHQLTREMQGTAVPAKEGKRCMYWFNRSMMLIITAGLLGCNFAVTYFQGNGVFIQTSHCSTLEVTFGHEVYDLGSNTSFDGTIRDGKLYFENSGRTVLGYFNLSNPPNIHYSYFSGMYKADFSNRDGISRLRPVYYETAKSANIDHITPEDYSLGMFYYCETEYAWVWTVKTFVASGVIPQKTLDRCPLGWLYRSPITEALTLEEVPTEGWRVWTGVLHITNDLAFRCLECNTDIDCGLERGVCGSGSVCECFDFAAGSFCNQDKPCMDIISIFDDGSGTRNGGVEVSTFYSYPGLTTYERPMYFRPWIVEDNQYAFKGVSVARNYTHWELLFYSGSRWISYRGEKSEFDVVGLHFDAHAYWLGLQDLPSSFWYSEPTNNYLPTGPLQWYRLSETRSEGNYGPFGREIEWEYRLECLAVDCDRSSRICGKYGTCVRNQVLTIGKQPVVNFFSEEIVTGGQCICEEGYHGHFCEFADADIDEETYDEGTVIDDFMNATNGDEEL